MNHFNKLSSLALLAFTLSTTSACTVATPIDDGTSADPVAIGSIQGRVMTLSGMPVVAADVEAGGDAGSTDSQGYFSLTHVAAGTDVDVIVQSDSKQGRNDISFTASADELKKVKTVLSKTMSGIEHGEVMYDEKVAKISIVGVGMRNHTGIAYRMFSALAENEINIHMISTSEIRTSVIIKEAQADKAVRVIHTAFDLDKEESSSGT